MKYGSIKLLLLFIQIIIIFSGIGCLGDSDPVPYDIPTGQLSSYEINMSGENFTNSSTFLLYSNKTVRTVTTVVNTSHLEINVPKEVSFGSKTEKGPGIEDFTAVGCNAACNLSDLFNFSPLSYNSTFSISGNRKTVNIEFTEPVTGIVAYSYSHEYGQFYMFLSRNETITILLPQGHNTGNIILGSPKPTHPDERFIDNEGRSGLVWNNPYPKQKVISVKYYKTSLPVILGRVGIILLIGFLITSVYFHGKIRKLQQKREAMEEDVRKKS